MKGIALFMALTMTVLFTRRQESAVKEGDRIIFFGDSITELGVKPKGYVSLIRDSLSGRFKRIEIIGAGVSGNRVPDLQARVGQDVLSKKPTHVVIYIGINDVWHFALSGKGTPKEVFRTGLQWLVDTLQASGTSVILCTPTLVGEKKQGTNELDAQLDEYADVTRESARSRGAILCDLRKAFFTYLEVNNDRNKESGILTYDKVHLNDEGNRLVATTLLQILRQ